MSKLNPEDSFLIKLLTFLILLGGSVIVALVEYQ